jgi:hypothetical protein
MWGNFPAQESRLPKRERRRAMAERALAAIDALADRLTNETLVAS